MDKVGTFPFGWIRGVSDENWQIIWSSVSKEIKALGAKSGRSVLLGQCASWQDAKAFADQLVTEDKEKLLDLLC